MRKFLDRLYSGSLGLAGVFLVGIFGVMIGEAVMRKMGSYIPGASELVGWFCAAAGFLALPATFKRGDMVRVGVVADALPPRIQAGDQIRCQQIGDIRDHPVVTGFDGLVLPHSIDAAPEDRGLGSDAIH